MTSSTCHFYHIINETVNVITLNYCHNHNSSGLFIGLPHTSHTNIIIGPTRIGSQTGMR